ncbi:MAG: hypothetical protein J6T10_05575 [Methanobrevibacter sp.]|nr:hypothetical protein [Methanobrevibacter sp.]
MRIKEINDYYILFDNGGILTYSHEQDCCENNYADFKAIDDIAKACEFNEFLIFEEVAGSGFRFGNVGKMVFVPCYSEQNGYYSSMIEIIYNGERVTWVECELIEYD